MIHVDHLPSARCLIRCSIFLIIFISRLILWIVYHVSHIVAYWVCNSFPFWKSPFRVTVFMEWEKSSFAHSSIWNIELELFTVLTGKWLLHNDMLPLFCLGGRLLTNVSIIRCFSLDTFVVKFLTRQITVSMSLYSLSLPLLVAADGFLLTSLESFVDSSSLMTPIVRKSFSTTITSSQFFINVGFAARLTNYAILVGSADV